MDLPFRTLDDFDLYNKKILLRAELNSPIDPQSKEIIDTSRIDALSRTLDDLSDSAVVIIAHQGRPGSADFIDLSPHAQRLSELGYNVEFVNDIIGNSAISAIKRLSKGKILVLDNVRKIPEETKKMSFEEAANTSLVKNLSPLFDIFVQDGFGVAHRSQPSVIGFTEVLPSAAGRLVESEYRALSTLVQNVKHPYVVVLGGAKLSTKIPFIEHLLENEIVDYVLTGGLISNVFLYAKGIKINPKNIGKAKDDLIELAKNILKKHSEKIILPVDIAFEHNGERKEVDINNNSIIDSIIYDVGSKTLEEYSKIINSAKTIFANGPLGYFENPLFAKGTDILINLFESSKADIIVGGGHLGAVISKRKVPSNIYISTGGGAALAFISGKSLPLFEALKRSLLKFN